MTNEAVSAPVKFEKVAVWLFRQYCDFDDWSTAPQRKRDYYRSLAREMIWECDL